MSNCSKQSLLVVTATSFVLLFYFSHQFLKRISYLKDQLLEENSCHCPGREGIKKLSGKSLNNILSIFNIKKHKICFISKFECFISVYYFSSEGNQSYSRNFVFEKTNLVFLKGMLLEFRLNHCIAKR